MIIRKRFENGKIHDYLSHGARHAVTHNDVIRTFLRFLNFHILHLFEILHGANIHLFEIFCKSFDGKA